MVKHFLGLGHQVIAAYNKHHYLHDDNALLELVRLDCADKDEVHKIIFATSPNVIIHCAATTQSVNEVDFYNNNILATENICKAAQLSHSKVIFLSTDLVYETNNSDSENPFNEDSPLAELPINAYAKSKILAEKKIISMLNDYIIFRPTVMYGNSPIHANSFSNFIENNILNNKIVTVFTDQYRNFLFVDDLCKALEIALYKGIYNEVFVCGGDENLSRAEFANRYVEFFNLDKSLIKEIRTEDLVGYAGKANKINLDCSKLRQLGWEPHNMVESLKKIKMERNISANFK